MAFELGVLRNVFSQKVIHKMFMDFFSMLLKLKQTNQKKTKQEMLRGTAFKEIYSYEMYSLHVQHNLYVSGQRSRLPEPVWGLKSFETKVAIV